MATPTSTQQTANPPLLDLARNHARLGNYDRAFHWLEEFLSSGAKPRQTLSSNPMHDPLRLDPRYFEAMAKHEVVVYPPSPSHRADLARLKVFHGRADEALADLTEVFELAPEDSRIPRWQDSMAWAHFAKADHLESLRWADRVLRQDVSPHAAAFAHLMRAANLVHLEQFDAAREAALSAAQAWPDIELNRDLAPMFMSSPETLEDAYLGALSETGVFDRAAEL